MPPLPAGFGVVLDPGTRELRPGVWFGGTPARVLRLTPAGVAAWAPLRDGVVRTAAEGQLARQFVDAGLAHPVPPAVTGPPDLTVLVPVLDRPAALHRCLAALGPAFPVVVIDDGSHDPASLAAVARDHGARLIRRAVNGGPAAARNTGLAAVTSEFVAFVDSDCVPPAGWLPPLLAHLGDPAVAAVAPRIVAGDAGGWLGRYLGDCGPLDLGPAAARVTPGGRVSYVPSAALLVRRSALRDVAERGVVFDEAMRYGEDVDLVWRLDRAGLRVRYEPAVHVAHEEPRRASAALARRVRYGTSAAPLARAHPGAARPLVLHPGPALVLVALLARRPLPAAAAFTGTVALTARTLRRADVPTHGAVRMTLAAVTGTALGVGRYATQLAAPVLAAALVPRRSRCAALALLLAPPVVRWWQGRRRLDGPRFVLAHLADEIAYGAGVWTGAARHRTTAPLRPRLTARPGRPRTTARKDSE